MRQRRTPEFWKEVRGLVERGLSLKKTSQRFGLAYSYLVQKAAFEGWKLCYSGRPRVRDYAASTRRREQMALAERRREEAQTALDREASVVVIDLKRAEQLTHRVLATHSAQMKVTLSELITETAEQLRTDKDIKAKDKALALGALSIVSERLYHWQEDFEKAANAVHPTYGIGARWPEQLAAMAQRNRDEDSGPCARECDAQGMGPSATAPEQPRAASHGCPVPKNEAPPLPVNQPVQPRRETTVEPPPPVSPQERRRQELEELDRLRAEWRGGR